MKKNVSGINIQWPISQLILIGDKTIETRTYPLPLKYVGKELALIETPGKNGNFKARIVGLIVFSECFEYRNAKEFYADLDRHKVSPTSPWAWTEKANKWGWVIEKVIPLEAKLIQKRRGIVFTNDITL